MIHRLFIFCFSTLLATSVCAQEKVTERSDWQKYFVQYQTSGTIVVADQREAVETVSVFDAKRAAQPYPPASTFKIPHTLFALDSGVLRDEFQVFRWDGVKRAFAGHNQDQDLRSAMRNSTLWVYQGFAKQIGEEKARRYLQQIDYGNADPTTDHGGDYWIDGNL